ncbi:MAG: hypothetical protein ACOC89_02075 [Candidatus Saliniplasma sp.]
MISLITNQGGLFLYTTSIFLCCGFVFFTIALIAIFYAFYKYSESSGSYKEDHRTKTKDRIETDGQGDDDRYSSSSYEFDEEKHTGKKVSFLDKILGKKKVCDECGSELIYKKSYDSYYCPECRTFK